MGKRTCNNLQGNWDQSAAEVGQPNWKLVIDTAAGNGSVNFRFKWLPELGDDENFLHAIDVLAEFQSIDKQVMANRRKLKKRLEQEDVNSES